jgi:hypothetical protein
MHSNGTMDILGLVLRIRLQPPQEILRRHVLDINILDSFRDIWRSEIPPHDNVYLDCKTFFFCIYL